MENLKNPFWLGCLTLFCVHQVLQKGLGMYFWWADNYLDSLLCMPILLGGLLLERRFLFKKNKTYTFSFFETIIIISFLGIIFEEGFPRWSNRFTKDYWDYLNYFIGGIGFYFLMNKKRTLDNS